MFTWKFAVILIVQLLIHEYGHIFAMKKVGIKTKGIYLIPFVGGAAVASEDFKTRRDEVYVALMGPIFGFGCALVMMIIYYFTQIPMYAAGASWMAMVNLFNLLPINPLDGGRVMKSIAFSLNSWFGFIFMGLGIVGSIFLALIAHIWIFIFVIIISSIELGLEIYFYKKHRQQEQLLLDIKNKYIELAKENNLSEEQTQQIFEEADKLVEPTLVKPAMTTWEMIISTGFYFLLAIILFYFMAVTMNIPGAKMAMELLQ